MFFSLWVIMVVFPKILNTFFIKTLLWKLLKEDSNPLASTSQVLRPVLAVIVTRDSCLHSNLWLQG